ncbi:MAG: hypothetical protein KDD66_17175 [Bdellovibrionales bacterium]|nr:hypothetical protein [Bdellovibrionales bacterium]
MSAVDADILEEVLRAQAARLKGSLNIVEWGGGISTIYFCRFLLRLGVQFTWTVLESDLGYFSSQLYADVTAFPSYEIVVHHRNGRIERRSSHEPGCSMLLRAVVWDKGNLKCESASYASDRLVDLDRYVDFPEELGRPVDVAIVDGRKRRRCMLAAAKLMSPAGVTLLHDAWRDYYHCAFSAFRSGRRVGEELWIGSQQNTDFSQIVPDESRFARHRGIIERVGVDHLVQPAQVGRTFAVSNGEERIMVLVTPGMVGLRFRDLPPFSHRLWMFARLCARRLKYAAAKVRDRFPNHLPA